MAQIIFLVIDFAGNDHMSSITTTSLRNQTNENWRALFVTDCETYSPPLFEEHMLQMRFEQSSFSNLYLSFSGPNDLFCFLNNGVALDSDFVSTELSWFERIGSPFKLFTTRSLSSGRSVFGSGFIAKSSVVGHMSLSTLLTPSAPAWVESSGSRQEATRYSSVEDRLSETTLRANLRSASSALREARRENERLRARLRELIQHTENLAEANDGLHRANLALNEANQDLLRQQIESQRPNVD